MRKGLSFNKILRNVFPVLFLFGTSVPAWAVQSHGGSEGLISHQIGHTLFFAGMIYLLVRIYQSDLKGSGWFEFKCFLWLIVLWNLLTFSGHWIRETVDARNFVLENGQTARFTIETFSDLAFYASSLDHLVLVPAFIMLLRALTIWGRTT